MATLAFSSAWMPSISTYLTHVHNLSGPVEMTSATPVSFLLEASGFEFLIQGTGMTYEAGTHGDVPVAGTIQMISLVIESGTFWILHGLALPVATLMTAMQRDRTGTDVDALEKLFLGFGIGFGGDYDGDDVLAPDADDFDGTPMDLTGADDVDLRGGNDLFAVAGGDDTVVGGSGNDTLHGEGGADTIGGGSGGDLLYGGKGADTINGGANRDVVDGGAGVDILRGGDADDTLQGGDGADTLEGGRGNDSLVGGRGADLFQFLESTGDDTVKGFDPLADVLQIDANALLFDTEGNGVRIDWAAGSLLVRGAEIDDLDVGLNIFLV
jgi:hypothetical protein